MERVMVFIDGSNLYHSLKNALGHAHIDLSMFVELLCSGRELITAYYYNAPVRKQDGAERYQRQQRFFQRIRSLPYFKLRLGRLEPRQQTLVEKGVDVKIAVDILVHAFRDTYDTAILVTVDGDFAAVADQVSEMGKHVENAYFREGRSRELENVCHKFVELTQEQLMSCLMPAAE